MGKKTRDEDAFTGLEAAIVLIAFVIVAAVFSYVLLGAGFFATQKSQETVHKSVEQATSNLQMLGQMYGLVTGSDTSGITEIKFTIGLAPGAPSVDLTKLTIVFSTANSQPNTYTYSASGTPSLTEYAATDAQTGSRTESMKAQDQIQIYFLVNTVPKNTRMNIEIRPAVGAALPFSKTTPPHLEQTNVLF
jgi:flagellin FlaB